MKNLHSWNYFYTTAGRDGRDKFQVWLLGLKLAALLIVVVLSPSMEV